MMVGDRGAHGDVVEGLDEARLGGVVDRALHEPHGDLRPLGQFDDRQQVYISLKINTKAESK